MQEITNDENNEVEELNFLNEFGVDVYNLIEKLEKYSLISYEAYYHRGSQKTKLTVLYGPISDDELYEEEITE